MFIRTKTMGSFPNMWWENHFDVQHQQQQQQQPTQHNKDPGESDCLFVCACTWFVRLLNLYEHFSPVRYVSFVCFTLESSKDRLYSWHVEMHAKQMCRHKYTYQFYLNESKWSQRIDFHSNAVNSIWVLLSRQTNNSHSNFNHLNFNGFTVQNIGLTSTYVLKLLEQATHASFISPDND